jgi:hypothetical protein
VATIAEQKSALVKWTPVVLFNVTLKDGTPRYWAKQGVTFAGNPYLAIVLEHSELKIEGNGVYGVDAVTQISLTLNNADANLNSLIAPANWQGGIIQPRFIFVAPDGTTTTDSIVYPKFLIDLPTATWPRIEFSAHNKWNLARKMLPVSLVGRKDRYPFPDTDAERAAAGSDPTSEFFAIGYDPATGKGNWKTPPSTPYRRHEYDGTREKLKEMGLEVRFGGFGKVPPTVVGTPKKGEKADYIGNANEAKYGQAVPLVFGICRIQPIVLDTGCPSGIGGWNGARLSHYLLSDGVTFPAEEHTMGIEDVLDVFIPDNAKYQRIPETSGDPSATGAWSFQGGYFGSQKAPASSKYRNIDQAIDFPDPKADFTNRDLYSGLAYLEIGFPKELSGEDGIGPKLEAIVKGLKIETWDSGGNSTWQWTDNPVWIFVHLLKLLRWTTAEMDKTTIYNAAAYCDGTVPSGKKRFRCNLPLTSQTRAADILRGIRNNCRMYTSFAQDGKLQLKIAQNVAGEGGLAFALDNTNIMRGDDGQLLVEKFHRSVFETANIFSISFQNEDNKYNADSFTRVDVANVNQIDEKVPADSIFPIIGIPSFDQAERQIEWARQEQVTLNEYYRVTCSLALIEAKVGQVGTITEPRHALISQQCRIRAMGPGRDAGTVELILQKHSDGAYTDQSVSTPFTRAQADSSYTPRSVGGQTSASPAPRLTELAVADPVNSDKTIFRLRVEFKPPEQNYEGIFSRATKIRDVVVATSGGSIPGGQILFVEVAPVKAGLRGLASEYLLAVIPSGGNSNSITLTCELPPEADQYILFIGNFPGQTYENLVEPSPGTAPFTITIPNLARNFGSIPPDPAFDHVQVFYSYNSSPDVLRDAGRTFSPTETTVEFEPESPAAEDTQVTVYVSSVNAGEDDFYPINISPKATLSLTYEAGPAADWTVELMPGPTPGSVICKFTRPRINGKRLFWVFALPRDTSIGQWRRLDENAGAAQTYYDGSAIAHESLAGLKIKKDPGQPAGFGTAKPDDLILLDVAGGSFDLDRCQWATVDKFLDDLGAETTVGNARYIELTGGLFRPQTTQDLRMKIVRSPWTWDTEGYLGNPTGPFIKFWEWIGDREGDEFIMAPVEMGRNIAELDVELWIENDYCRSSGGGIRSNNKVTVRAGMDYVIPGPVENLSVTGGSGVFVAKWQDPLVGAATIDDVAIQYADDAAFTAGVNTSQDWGDVNTLSGTDPGKTYYWRVAVHNLSDQPSDPSTTATLGATGWGPWQAYGAPDPVSSGSGGGLPSDSVIPGPVQNLTVTGANGEYVADWDDPATGNLTLDDIALQYATDSNFTFVAGTPAGWGNVTHLQSTSPGTTYYFRVAAHNQSGQPSHASTSGWLGPTGWGPWTAYGAPTPVSSGGTSNAPIDNVIPGFVESLQVTGGGGEFVANWLDPVTGNLTIDDTAIQWATDASFAFIVGTAKGWGPVNRLRSTDPGKTYYFKIAVHNQSGKPSDSSTTSLGATGWGPWTLYAPAVSSGLVAAPENIVFNGGFETNDGTDQPAGWIRNWDVGAAGSTYGLDPYGAHEGANCFVIYNNTTGKTSVASKSFGVRSGEFLDYSVWAYRNGGPNNGFYFRVYYHASNPDFLPADTPGSDDLYSGAELTAVWAQYQGRVKVPAGIRWARVALYNYGGTDIATNYYFDDLQVLRVISGQEIDDNTIPPNRFTGSARTEFVETFEEPLLSPPWTILGGGTVTYPTSGVDGGKVIRFTGSKNYAALSVFIPYDSRKLYRMTCRARLIQNTNPSFQAFYCGMVCSDAAKANLGTVYPAAAAVAQTGWPVNVWQEFTGYFKGTGTHFEPAPDATNPTPLRPGTAYFSPQIAGNWPQEAPVTNIIEVDDIRIDVLEEEQYTTRAPSGTLSNLTYQVYYPYGDNRSSTISFYWTYTQGIVKADQFCLLLSDGTAYAMERVKALPGASAKYNLTVYEVIYNRQFTASITPEAVGAAGVVDGASTLSWPPITPSSAVGSEPAGSQVVGRVDWGGGNIWYDSLQYRNNTPPSNPPSNSIYVEWPESGSGGVLATIKGLTPYNQGTYIATHLAVLVKFPSGTVDVNRDMVVARISLASLTDQFVIPIDLPDNGSYTVAVVAVALTKNGAVPHPTWKTTGMSRNPDKIFISTYNSPRFIDLGNPGNPGETIRVYPEIRMYSPNSYLTSYSAGGGYQGGFSGDASAMYMCNAQGKCFTVMSGGTYPLFGFNMTYSSGLDGGLMIGNSQHYYGYNPVGGGYLLSEAGAGTWVGPSGSKVVFGPAGPHCGKCGYDFWLIATTNSIWDASLHICGWCGEVYRRGPKSVLRRLTKEQRSEIIQVQNVKAETPATTRLRRRGAGRRGKPYKSRLRCVRGHGIRTRRRN